MTHSRKRLTFVALVALVGSVAAGAEAELVAKYFAALRVRGLFVVAEEYASARLAGADLAAAERTLLTIELARTLLEHGGSAIGAQREELWADAQKSLQDLLATSRDDAARLPAQAWLALIPAAQAQTLAWEALLTPEDESLRGAAIVRLRRSIVEIKSLLPRLDGAAKGSSVRGVGAGDLTAAAQLPAAQRELAEVLIDLADLEPGSHERTANLLDAAAQLERIVRPAADAALGTHIRVLQARAARLQGDERRAASLLDGIAGSDVGFPEKDEALAERLRLDLERGKPDAAFELVARRLRQSEPPTAELRAAIVDVLLACWQLATTRGDGKLAAQLLAEARSQHEQTSGRWRTWTAAKLDRQQTDAELGIPLASLVRQARGAWQSKRLSEAAGKYGAASELAQRTGRTDLSADYALTRASILLAAEDWPAAAQAFAAAVVLAPQHPRAAEADLLKCYALGRAAPAAAEYPQALRQHLERYSASPTVGEAQWLLALHAEQTGQWAQAADWLRHIPAGHARRPEVDLRLTGIDLRQLETKTLSETDRAAWEESARQDVERIAPDVLRQRISLSPAQCRTLLNCAQLELQRRDHGSALADQCLAKALSQVQLERQAAADAKAPLGDDWKRIDQTAAQLKLISLAGQQHWDQAREILTRLKTVDPDRLLTILSGLADLAARIEPRRQYELAQLQKLMIADLIARKHELTPGQQQQLDDASAQACLALGDQESAIDIYRRQTQSAPSDQAALLRLIDVLERRGQPADLKEAQALWIRLEQLAAAGTPSWIEARLNIADLQRRQGDAAGARKLLGVTRTLYPQLGTPELKARGEALWEQVK